MTVLTNALRKQNYKSLFGTLLVFSAIICGCRNTPTPPEQTDSLHGDLIIFHAGSLTVPIKALADSFQKINPRVVIKPEAAGSLTSIRKISELGRQCDILASADAIMIDKMMIPKLTSWNLEFAVNEMVIAFNKKSAMADNINVENWPAVLSSDKVRIGRADPSSDPCGYRTVLTLKLANSESLLKKDQKYIRPKEMDLLALLETHTIDYIFIYKSVALQHDLRFIELPDSISLSNPALSAWYNTASITIPGNSPGETIVQPGEPMVYGMTIPYNAPNPVVAKAFIHFIVNHGQAIIQASKQEPLIPARLSNRSTKPHWLHL